MNTIHLRRLWGAPQDHIEQAKVAIVMLFVVTVYIAVSAYVLPDYVFNIYEFVGTWTGLVCVWLSRTRNILCWPWGIVSSVALGIFFGGIGLPGQQWLNWGYFLIIQIWAWPHWVFGGRDHTELPVTRLSGTERGVMVVVVGTGTFLIYTLIDHLVPGSLFPWLDALVVSASIVAQYLLGRKKIESWILWLGPVNLLSIALFFLAGAYMLVVLYCAFFIHAYFALRAWAHVKN